MRRGSTLLGALVPALLVGLLGLGPSAALPSAGASTIGAPLTAAAPPAVTVTLNSISPRNPDAMKLAQPVTIVVTAQNNTDNTYADVRFGLQRGQPMTQQHQLDDAMRNPPNTEYSIPSPLDLNKQLLPHGQLTITYRTTTQDLCLCVAGVYPYALVVEAVSDPQLGFAEVGRVQMFLPAFLQTPKPVSAGWVWPLLDKPHRTIDENVFTDEQLAGEVGPGGRLDRALRVAELVRGKVRLALLIDPGLLDDLAVMAGRNGYRVRSGTSTVAGTGGRLAAAWLARLRALRPAHDFVLTAYADPDINAVARAGLKWTSALDPQVQSRITATLDGDFSSDLLNWPVGSALTGRALDSLVGGGASTVLLSDAALPGQNNADPKPDAISPLPSATGKAVALVTDGPIESTVIRALKLGASPANDQQTLLSQLAIRAEQSPAAGHFVVLVPDRYVNADPQVAAATIESVIGTGWSRPISIPRALATVTPVDRGALQTSAESSRSELSPQNMSTLAAIGQQVTSLSEALHDNDAAALLLAGFNNGTQRAEAAAWRVYPAGAAQLVAELQGRIDARIAAIHLVQPAVGTYSLSSSDSPVVVTVSNQLPRPVTVLVSVDPGPGVIGFQATVLAPQVIAARSIETIRVPSHIRRVGRFQVVATLRTPDGRQLGKPLQLNLRATSIGTFTKVITVVAISVLVLALLRRLVRRLRHGPRPATPRAAVVGPPAAERGIPQEPSSPASSP